MKKLALLILALVAGNALAQEQQASQDWLGSQCYYFQHSRSKYAKIPKKGKVENEKCFIFNGYYAYEIDLNEQFNPDSFAVIRMGNQKPAASPSPAPTGEGEEGKDGEKKPVEGTITRKERCKTLSNDARTLREKETIYEEDKDGNLVPLSKAQISERLHGIEATMSSICNDK